VLLAVRGLLWPDDPAGPAKDTVALTVSSTNPANGAGVAVITASFK
jgi:hypothetical protein